MCAESMEIGEEREMAPGVRVQRRCVVSTFAAILALSALPAGARRLDKTARPLTFDEFLAEVVPVAKRLVADTTVSGQDRYLRRVASYAVRLSELAQPDMRDSGQGAGPGTFIGFHPGGDPFTVLHWRMDPNSRIRTHAHTYGNVVTLGLEGKARVVNYEVIGNRDYRSTDRFQARRTVDQRLGSGGVNLVNLERNYIHGSWTSTSMARGLDITTRIRPKEPTPYLILDDPDRAISGAHWEYDKV